MKISLNLATASSARQRYGLVWAIPTAILAAVLLVVMCVVAGKNLRAYRRVHQSVVEVQQEEAQVRRQEGALRQELERPQWRETYRQTGFINGVIDRRQFSTIDFVEKVTKLLPDDVRLDALTFSREGKERIARLTVSGHAEEDVEKFLINLEDSSDFAEVTIISQGLAQGGEEPEPATVACTARYVGGPTQ
jgi:hypothetical protein